jgi:hypothetical protein
LINNSGKYLAGVGFAFYYIYLHKFSFLSSGIFSVKEKRLSGIHVSPLHYFTFEILTSTFKRKAMHVCNVNQNVGLLIFFSTFSNFYIPKKHLLEEKSTLNEHACLCVKDRWGGRKERDN